MWKIGNKFISNEKLFKTFYLFFFRECCQHSLPVAMSWWKDGRTQQGLTGRSSWMFGKKCKI